MYITDGSYQRLITLQPYSVFQVEIILLQTADY